MEEECNFEYRYLGIEIMSDYFKSQSTGQIMVLAKDIFSDSNRIIRVAFDKVPSSWNTGMFCVQ
jgi:hypothetical protein